MHDGPVKRLTVLVLLTLVAVGCNGSDDSASLESSPPTTSTTPSDRSSDRPPRTFEELMARLPPFDEPASPDVTAYRKATIDAFFARCLPGSGGADRASFVAANRRVLDSAKVFPGAAFVGEYSIGRRDSNGCPEGTGPVTYYTTYRHYRLPHGTKLETVWTHYERQFPNWLESAVGACEHAYGQGPAYVAVSACNSSLRVLVRARAPAEPPASPELPPRPFGAQYPPAPDYLATPLATSYESKPGESCERTTGADVPSIIVPPPPGIRAEIEGKEVVVEWTLGTVHGDCPPSELILSYPAVTAHTIRESVHAGSGVTRMPLLESVPPPTKLTAVAVSVDGVESRRVSVLVRRPS